MDTMKSCDSVYASMVFAQNGYTYGVMSAELKV